MTDYVGEQEMEMEALHSIFMDDLEGGEYLPTPASARCHCCRRLLPTAHCLLRPPNCLRPCRGHRRHPLGLEP